MDRILKQLLQDYIDANDYRCQDSSTVFEYFTIFTIVTDEYGRTFEVEDVYTGGKDDTGIDGLAIIVNGKLIDNAEDIQLLVETNGSLDVHFIFIQSKSNPNFSYKEMNNFSYGVCDFFSEKPKLRRNEAIQQKADFTDCLLKNTKLFKDNPRCDLFFVTSGSWSGDKDLLGALESGKKNLEATGLFSTVRFTPYGNRELQKKYRDCLNSIESTFVFKDKVTLPEIPSIDEAYYGIIPLSEFKNLIIDENGNLLNIFDDNVRDFQGLDNPINKFINDSLITLEPNLFTVLNNGVTIVASEAKHTGDKFIVSDYQIVNGCQTSNVLSNHVDKTELKSLMIPIRLIITKNDDLKNQITIATNSQTAIRREQLQAMKDYQKNLEQYYQTIEGDGKLYYERRTRQYQSKTDVQKARIITIQNQIKSFGAFYLEIPHRVNTYFGQVLQQNVEGDKPSIFVPDQKYILYYTSALAYYRLESLFKRKELDAKYRKIKWHLLTIYSKIANPDFPRGLAPKYFRNDKHSEEYCSPIIELLNDHNDLIDKFKQVEDIVIKSGVDYSDKQAIKNVTFTNQLLKPLSK